MGKICLSLQVALHRLAMCKICTLQQLNNRGSIVQNVWELHHGGRKKKTLQEPRVHTSSPAALPACMPLTWWTAVLAFMASHRPSEAMISLAPLLGSAILLTSGSGSTTSPACGNQEGHALTGFLFHMSKPVAHDGTRDIKFGDALP